jgi:hypothetical protein
MRKTNQIISLILVLILTNTLILAQEYKKVDQSNTIVFDDASKISETYVNVSDDFNFLALNIECKLTAGSLSVELINPKGDVKGNFTIIVVSDRKNAQSEEGGNGQIEKNFRNPITGNWLIRFKPKNASGSAKIFSTLIYNQRVDILELDQIIDDTNSNIK